MSGVGQTSCHLGGQIMIRLLNPLYFLTLAWLVAATVMFGPQGMGAVALVMAVKVLPLLAFLPFILKKDADKLMTFSLLLLFYMGYTTMLCFKPGVEGVSGMVGTVLVTVLLVVSQLEVKRQGKLRKAQA